MRKLLFFAGLLASFSAASFADGDNWTKIAKGSKDSLYADQTTIERHGNIVRMWAMYDLKSAMVRGDLRAQSVKFLGNFDCSAKRYFRSAEWIYSGPMGHGDLVNQENRTQDWQQIKSGTPDEILLEFACKDRSNP